jgi:general secretion pathway protein H
MSSPAGNDRAMRQPATHKHARRSEAGFTLVEILAVMSIAALSLAAVSFLYSSPSGATKVKSAALMTASRLRDLRAAAMSRGEERVARIDPGARTLLFGDGRPVLRLDPSIDILVTSAEGESATPKTAGVRFYPNGSSSGATIKLTAERQTYEIRVNWLTGRVSASPL